MLNFSISPCFSQLIAYEILDTSWGLIQLHNARNVTLHTARAKLMLSDICELNSKLKRVKLTTPSHNGKTTFFILRTTSLNAALGSQSVNGQLSCRRQGSHPTWAPVQAQLLHLRCSSLLMSLGKQKKMIQALGPSTYMGDQEEAPGNWLQHSPVSAVSPFGEWTSRWNIGLTF